MSSPIFNEMSDAQGTARPHYQAFDNWLKGVSADTVQIKQTEADKPENTGDLASKNR